MKIIRVLRRRKQREGRPSLPGCSFSSCSPVWEWGGRVLSEPVFRLLPSCPASEHMTLSAPRLPSYALIASTADLPARDPSHLRAVPQACRLSAFTPSPEDGFLSSPAFPSALVGPPTGGDGKPKAFLVLPLPLPHATASIPTC